MEPSSLGGTALYPLWHRNPWEVHGDRRGVGGGGGGRGEHADGKNTMAMRVGRDDDRKR